MDKEKKEKLIMFVHKWLLHLEALCIIILMLTGFVFLYNDHQLKLEINENCGWGEDNFKCYCEKSEALAIKAKIDNPYADAGDLLNVTLDR